MAYQYGSDSLNIKNPFKLEGLLYFGSGAVIFITGILSLISLRGQIVETGLAAGWLNLTVSLLLVLTGITFLFKGFNKRSRFYVGREAPTSLASNEARGGTYSAESQSYYSPDQMERMIVGRKNPTFQEPVTLFDRMAFNFKHNFIFLPYAMRNYLHILVKNTGYSLIGLGVYFIALLSGSVGLTMLVDTSFYEWLSIALCVFLLVVWLKEPVSVKKATTKKLQTEKRSNIAWVIALAILIPAVAELLLRQGVTIPQAPFNPVFPLVVFYVMIIGSAVTGIALAVLRANLAAPNTEVSEHRDHWDENAHPKDFFRALDMELAELRYKEIPNRVYRALNPELNMEGSMDKGSFKGDTIQETQPIYKENQYPQLLKNIRFYAAISGHVLCMFSALLLYIRDIPGGFEIEALFSYLFYPAAFAIFGFLLLTVTHIYWGEIQFESHLIQFWGEGTYTESKIRTGKAITDSTESENVLVRTSFTPWVMMTRIQSTTQAKSGANAFQYARYVLRMDKDDEKMNQLVTNVTNYLDEKEVVAFTTSDKDIKNMEALHAINNSGNDNLEELVGEAKDRISD